MSQWASLPTAASLASTIKNLTANGFSVIQAKTGAEAKEKLLALLPEGAEVMTNSSTTLDQIGATEAINTSPKLQSVRAKLTAMDRTTQGREMKMLGAAPAWAVGSVHAVTEDGKILIASATGSQLPGYAYGSDQVVWVVGTQKIVPDLMAGMKRLEDYVLPLESERAHKAYGVPGSSINKLMIFNHENPGRITIILVDEILGF